MMTKQEQIEEGIDIEIKSYLDGETKNAKELRNRILKRQASQGAVVKSDRELPDLWDGYTMDAYLQKLKKAGFVAVESLIGKK